MNSNKGAARAGKRCAIIPAVIKSTADKMHIDRCGILTVDALIKGEPGDIKERFFAGRIYGVWKVITFLGPEEKSIQP